MSLGSFDLPPLTLKLSVRSHYATMTRLICAPPSHTSVTDFTVSIFLNIIGLFRSTVLRVMSPTRFLCATMMGCNWVVLIHLLRLAFVQKCFHYTTMTCLICAPPSHISVIDFTMSRLTISITFYPVGIYYH